MRLGKLIFCERFVIADTPGDPYLIRWRLIDTPWFGMYLHRIIRSDHDRHLHDHPFDFVSILLWGSYREQRARVYGTSLGPRWLSSRSMLSVAFRRAEDAHRLVLRHPCWTLVLRGRRRREWGFWTKDGWVRHDVYLSRINKEKAESKTPGGGRG